MSQKKKTKSKGKKRTPKTKPSPTPSPTPPRVNVILMPPEFIAAIVLGTAPRVDWPPGVLDDALALYTDKVVRSMRHGTKRLLAEGADSGGKTALAEIVRHEAKTRSLDTLAHLDSREAAVPVLTIEREGKRPWLPLTVAHRLIDTVRKGKRRVWLPCAVCGATVDEAHAATCPRPPRRVTYEPIVRQGPLPDNVRDAREAERRITQEQLAQVRRSRSRRLRAVLDALITASDEGTIETVARQIGVTPHRLWELGVKELGRSKKTRRPT